MLASPGDIETEFAQTVHRFIDRFHASRQPHVRRTVYAWCRNWTQPENRLTQSELAQDFHRMFYREQYRAHREEINRRRRTLRRRRQKRSDA